MTLPSLKRKMIPRSEVVTQLRKPVHLITLVALLAVCVLFFFLGKWQWDRTHNILSAERAAAAQPVELGFVAAPELLPENIGRTVFASGRFSAENQIRVTQRLENGEPSARVGEWVVAEFVSSTGDRIAVLRGWVAAGSPVTTPENTVDIAGVMQPNEIFYEGSSATADQVVVIDSNQLSSVWGSDLAAGFIVLQQQVPSSAADPVPVPPTVSTADVPFPLQNFFYAIQWWIFALFAVALYVRWIFVSARQSTQPAPDIVTL